MSSNSQYLMSPWWGWVYFPPASTTISTVGKLLLSGLVRKRRLLWIHQFPWDQWSRRQKRKGRLHHGYGIFFVTNKVIQNCSAVATQILHSKRMARIIVIKPTVSLGRFFGSKGKQLYKCTALEPQNRKQRLPNAKKSWNVSLEAHTTPRIDIS